MDINTRTRTLVVVAIVAALAAGSAFLVVQEAATRSAPPKITGASPTTVQVGTTVTLAGSDFAATGNAIQARGRTIATGLSAAGGTTLTFSFPDGTPCRADQGACPLKVQNDNGISNAVPIRVIPGVAPTPIPTPTPAPVPPPTIKVLQPIGGRGWVRGTTLTVEAGLYGGTYYATSYGPMAVDLVKGGVKVRAIYAPPPPPVYNDGVAVSWPIPADIEPGADYQVEAFFVDWPQVRVRSEPFSILGETLTVRGRVTNAFTGVGIQGVRLQVGPPYAVADITDADGGYSFTRATDQWGLAIAHATPDKATCYIQSVSYAGPYNLPGGSYWLYRYAIPEPHDRNDVKPVLGPEIEHNIPLWPAADFSLQSDIPVRYSLLFGTQEEGGGNAGYRTEGYLSLAIPLDYDVRTRLWDEAGNVYTSPVFRAPRDRACTPAVSLTFQNGQFTWQ